MLKNITLSADGELIRKARFWKISVISDTHSG